MALFHFQALFLLTNTLQLTSICLHASAHLPSLQPCMTPVVKLTLPGAQETGSQASPQIVIFHSSHSSKV